eukprot:gb/GEZN01010838.1/.p1 GENE.gb/GEZN01010838.1/~~gb/GEZN01010838.1/.p1  ORF type:complete len:325 (+),score=28.20 gb/GEZN01010838.1/:121-1095(+)
MFSANDILTFVLLSSFVLMIQSSMDCDQRNKTCKKVCKGIKICLDNCPGCGQSNYPIAIALSVVSILICGAVILFTFGGPRQDQTMKIVSFLLLGIWLAGVGILTFDAPYLGAFSANGYFATWAAFLASFIIFLRVWAMRIYSRSDAVAVLFLGSLVMLIQTAMDCDNSACNGNLILGVMASVVSTVLSGLILAMSSMEQAIHQSLMTVAAVLCFMLWVATAGLLTFDAPYTFAGNAYFACWICFLTSGAWFFSLFRGHFAGMLARNDARNASRPASSQPVSPNKPADKPIPTATTTNDNYCIGCGEAMAADAAFCTGCGKHKK